MTKELAFQDQIPDNHCFGCGPQNTQGLRIKSYWLSENESICRFHPQPYHCAGPLGYLNGGVLATAIDCHTVCTAIAKGYTREGRGIGEGERVWFATGKLEISYRAPVLIDAELIIKAKITEAKEKKITLSCEAFSADNLCAVSEVVAVRVSNDW